MILSIYIIMNGQMCLNKNFEIVFSDFNSRNIQYTYNEKEKILTIVNQKYIQIPKELPTNIILFAPTGTGKTTALINNIPEYLKKYKRIIITLPTLTLCYDVSRKLREYRIRHLVDNSDERILKNNDKFDWHKYDVIVTTYEKALAILSLNKDLALNSIVFIDEIHLITSRLLSILGLLSIEGPKFILASATPLALKTLQKLIDALVIKLDTEKKVQVIKEEFHPLLKIKELVYNYPNARILVFIPNISRVKELTKQLNDEGISAVELHSKLLPYQRKQNIRKFLSGEAKVIVGTHTLAYGINFNVDIVVIPYLVIKTKPIEAHDIIQVIGRTGRSEEELGLAFLNVTNSEDEKVYEEFIREYENGMQNIINKSLKDFEINIDTLVSLYLIVEHNRLSHKILDKLIEIFSSKNYNITKEEIKEKVEELDLMRNSKLTVYGHIFLRETMTITQFEFIKLYAEKIYQKKKTYMKNDDLFRLITRLSAMVTAVRNLQEFKISYYIITESKIYYEIEHFKNIEDDTLQELAFNVVFGSSPNILNFLKTTESNLRAFKDIFKLVYKDKQLKDMTKNVLQNVKEYRRIITQNGEIISKVGHCFAEDILPDIEKIYNIKLL